MEFGLVKLAAADYKNDPVWRELRQDLEEKDKAYEGAKAARNPDLVKAQDRLVDTGIGSGAILGGLGAGAAGARSIYNAKGASKLVPAVLTPTLGMPLGATAGAVMGGLVTSPFRSALDAQENPTVKKNYQLASSAYDKAADRLNEYEWDNNYNTYDY